MPDSDPLHEIALAAVLGRVEAGSLTDLRCIAIGTLRDSPKVWRYGIERFAEGWKPGRILGNVPGDFNGVELPATPGRGREIAFPGLVLAVFYARESYDKPLMRLDTLGLVDNDGAIGFGDVTESNWAASMLVIEPDPSEVGVIKAFRLSAHSPIVLNSHDVRNNSNAGDRYDTRIIMQVKATNPARGRSLWGPKPADKTRGLSAYFDELNLQLTGAAYGAPGHISDHKTSGHLTNYLAEKTLEDGASGTATGVGARSIDADATAYPLLSDIGTPYTGRARKTWGLRALATSGSGREERVSRLALRFELELKGDKANSLARQLFGRVLPIKPLEDNTFGQSPVVFAQEQRLSDIEASLRVDRPVHWLLTMRLESNPYAADRPRADRLTISMFEHLTAQVKHIRSGRRAVRDYMPISFMPDLSYHADKNRLPWHVVVLVHDDFPWLRYIRKKVGGIARKDLRRPSHYEVGSIEPIMLRNMWISHMGTEKSVTYGVEANFDCLFATTAGNIVSQQAVVGAPDHLRTTAPQSSFVSSKTSYQPAISQLDSFETVARTLRFAVWIGSIKRVGEMPREIVIGAFRLRLSADAATPDDVHMHNLVSLHRFDPKLEPGERDQVKYALDARIELPVSALVPAGEDAPVGAESDLDGRSLATGARTAPADDPLVIPLDRLARGRYVLNASEWVTRGVDHSIDLRLRTTGSDSSEPPTTVSILTLEPAPFRVACVDYVEPRALRDDHANEVAVWNPHGENGLSWRLRDTTERVRLTFPPAVLGEAMEKSRGDDPERPPDIFEGRPAAARLGSATQIEIDPTYFDSDYHEPGWNLRRILGYAGQRAPGSILKSLRLELAYGMIARVEPRTEVMLSELAGMYGKAAERLKDDGTSDHTRHVNVLLTAQEQRLAVDSLWSGRPNRQLRLEEGVTFALRHYAEPIPPAKLHRDGPATPFRWPLAGPVPELEDVAPTDAKRIKDTFAFDKDDRRSFPGGIPWAFESANILLEVYARPLSEGGRLTDVRLSALGGWGGQRALFASSKSIIETETAQGRMHRYKLERIGRIGALWHRAKHVIIYERTVVPPRQFYNRSGLQQDELAGRPVLRKVEEYVEILELLRRYPENATSLSASGFLTGVEFKSRKIPVDSRWGGDVRTEGWRVPLWNRAFATESAASGQIQDPDDPSLIYPKPQIRCLFASESGGEISIEIDEPEKLVFFTSVDPNERENTDKWRPVRDVDFVDLPSPVVGRVKPTSAALTDAMLPGEPEHTPGWERLTLGLVDTKEAVALLHNRAAEGPAARLRNVTIARSASTPATPRSAALNGIAQHAANIRAELDGALGVALGTLERLDPQLNANAPAAKIKAKDAISKALGVPSFFSGLAEAAQKAPSIEQLGLSTVSGLGALPNLLRQQLDAEINRVHTAAAAMVKDAAGRLQRPADALAGAPAYVLGVIAELKVDSNYSWISEELREELVDALEGVREHIFLLDVDVDAELNELRQRLKLDVRQLSSQAGGALLEFEPGLAKLCDDLRDAGADLKREFDGAGGFVTAPLKDAAEAFERAMAAFADPLKRMLSRLAGGGTTMERVVPTLIDMLRTSAGQVKADLGDVGSPISSWIDAAVLRLADVSARVAAGIGKIAALGATDVSTPLEELVKHANAMMEAVIREIQNTARTVLQTLAAPDLMQPLVDLVVRLSAELEGDANAWAKAVSDQALVLSRAAGTAGAAARAHIEAARSTALAVIAKEAAAAVSLVDSALDQIAEAVNSLNEIVRDLLANTNKYTDAIKFALGIADGGSALSKEIEKKINEAIDAITDGTEQAVERIKAAAQVRAEEVARELEGRTRELLGAAQVAATEFLGTDPAKIADQAVRIAQEGADVLQLLRALGDPPKSDRLGLNRPQVAYVLNEVKKVVDITPAVTLVNRVSDTLAAADRAGAAAGALLEPFGVRLPTGSIAERFIPDKLKNLSVASLIPDMGGIDFRGLLERAGFPDLSDSEAIKITQSFDKAQQRALLEAIIDVPFTDPMEILSFGPVKIVVDDAHFYSIARASAGLGGTTQSANGRIAGDWRIVSGGQDILTFRKTGLFFDDSGRIDFKISPDRIELAAPLEFITNFLAASGKGSGLVIEPLMRGGVPSGVAATYNMALPDLTLGVFAISNLSLRLTFGIAAVPEFEIISELSIAQRTAPFTLSVWILNGGGYITQRLSFLPTAKPRPLLNYTLDIGIVAGVGLGFNFGVVSGGVWLQVGCSVALTWTTGQGGNTTTVTVFILARGNVDVAGLITASIMLLLEVSYDGARMIGRGTLRLSFKISVFYTLRVSQGVEYVFVGKEKRQDSYSDNFA